MSAEAVARLKELAAQPGHNADYIREFLTWGDDAQELAAEWAAAGIDDFDQGAVEDAIGNLSWAERAEVAKTLGFDPQTFALNDVADAVRLVGMDVMVQADLISALTEILDAVRERSTLFPEMWVPKTEEDTVRITVYAFDVAAAIFEDWHNEHDGAEPSAEEVQAVLEGIGNRADLLTHARNYVESTVMGRADETASFASAGFDAAVSRIEAILNG